MTPSLTGDSVRVLRRQTARARRIGRQAVTDVRVRDQLLTSVVNLAMPAAAALMLSPHDVGALWIAFGAYQSAIAVTRGWIAVPGQLAIGGRPTAAGTPPLIRHVVAPLALGAITVVAALVIEDDDVRTCLLVLAPALPLLLMLDCARHWAYSIKRADLPAQSSALWAVTHLAAFGLVAGRSPSAATLVAVWAVPGIAAALLLFGQLHAHRDTAMTIVVPRRQRLFLTADSLAGQLAAFVVPAAAGVVATLSDAGVFQNSRLLFRPVNVLLNLVLIAGIPSVTRASAPRDRLRLTRSLASRTVMVSLALVVAGLCGYAVVSATTAVELSWAAIGISAVESVVVGPYIAYALLATTMTRAGTLLAVRVVAVVVQLSAVIWFGDAGPVALAAASAAGMAVPSFVVPWWTSRLAHRDHATTTSIEPNHHSELPTC